LALASMNGSTNAEVILKGVTLIKNEMWDFLADRGLSRIETVGLLFDPKHHEAVETVESDAYPENTVVEEIRAGYLLNGKLLRPASVKVSRKNMKEVSDE